MSSWLSPSKVVRSRVDSALLNSTLWVPSMPLNSANEMGSSLVHLRDRLACPWALQNRLHKLSSRPEQP